MAAQAELEAEVTGGGIGVSGAHFAHLAQVTRHRRDPGPDRKPVGGAPHQPEPQPVAPPRARPQSPLRVRGPAPRGAPPPLSASRPRWTRGALGARPRAARPLPSPAHL